MKKGIFVRVLVCILTIGVLLYGYIAKQNSITELRLQIPLLSKELEKINQENSRLQYEIDQSQNPKRLLHLSKQPSFSHLKHPKKGEIIVLEEK